MKNILNDKTGNLIEDKSEQLKIHWTYYNKLKQIDSANSTKLKFRYDAFGNRIVKDIVNKSKEIYVRDAQGNPIVLYEIKNDSLMSKEYYIYGVNRLGYMEDRTYIAKKTSGKTIGGSVALPTQIFPNIPNPFVFVGTTSVVPVYFGKKRYELSDWLGNVRVVVNDRKTPVNSGSVTVSYMPQVVSVRDYYSFGFEMNERTYSQSKYRFSFNGKEDIEQRWYQDYGARYYHKALGRFISADPLIVQQKKYPWLSSYQFAGNTPVQAIDMDGLEPVSIGKKNPILQQLVIKVTKDEGLIDKISSLYYRELSGEPHKATVDIGLSHMIDPITKEIKPHDVFSVNEGKVFATGTSDSYGNYVVTEHKLDEGTFYVLYAHLSSINVKQGQNVKSGAYIGRTGNTGKGVTADIGKSLKHHLHLEVLFLPFGEYSPKDYSDLIRKRDKTIKRFNAITLDEVMSDEKGKIWKEEKGKKAEYWNKGDIPIHKLLNIDKK